ncbi:MAG: hypothetical protein MUO54_13105 [Anaerolineales bacterium]|nr:hypothetical protein [Anaerolineales bacterium]
MAEPERPPPQICFGRHPLKKTTDRIPGLLSRELPFISRTSGASNGYSHLGGVLKGPVKPDIFKKTLDPHVCYPIIFILDQNTTIFKTLFKCFQMVNVA